MVSSETIWRLIDEGETCLDIGSHVGYMASLMARRCGGDGKVVCFEPHPMLFHELTANIETWRRAPNVATIESHNIAVSDTSESACLKVPTHWDGNRGTASIAKDGDGARSEIVVKVRRLDELFGDIDGGQKFGVVKIDVEGHEAAVLSGGEKLLERGAIRDIVFEDTGGIRRPRCGCLKVMATRFLVWQNRFVARAYVAQTVVGCRRATTPTILRRLTHREL
ncbi:MAG: FkbM family methyltransferase [Pyrinomonadaceae bacterium MAG19_C2-C3]|nr:FkbM family methyltransferase [Pyrinomonadaceae bacterium MAG19_C2-C3]